MTRRPLFSVVFPLCDNRSVGLRAVQGWLDQRTDDTPFEIVVVDAGQTRLASQIERLLGPQDRLVHQPSTNEAVIYNAGAQAATSHWLLFTESHVVPEPGCVAALRPRLDRSDCDAAVLGSTHHIRSRFAEIDAGLNDRDLARIMDLGLWRAVGLRGFVVRRDLFDRLGAFTERHHRFAETSFAIRLVDAGRRLAWFEEVQVGHFDSDSLSEVMNAMSQGRLGACRFWQDEPQLAQKWFASPAPTLAQGFVHPDVARQVCRSLFAALGSRGTGLAHIWRLAKSLLVATAAGWPGQRFLARMRGYAEYLRFIAMLHVTHRRESDREALLDQYQKLRETCADIGSVLFQQEVCRAPSAADGPANQEHASLPQYRVNFFPPESWQGESYCWSEPTAALLLPHVVAGGRIRLDARPTGGWLARRPVIYVDGIRVPQQNITERDGVVEITAPAGRATRDSSLLSWDCDPFVPADSGLPDPRKLGVAIIRATVRATVRVIVGKAAAQPLEAGRPPEARERAA